jgi:hypothetical protein
MGRAGVYQIMGVERGGVGPVALGLRVEGPGLSRGRPDSATFCSGPICPGLRLVVLPLGTWVAFHTRCRTEWLRAT